MIQTRSIATCAVFLALLPCLLAGCSDVKAKGENQAMPAMPVKVQVEQEVPIIESSEYVGTLKSRDSTTLSPQVEGQITKIFVKSGDHVAAGAPLMQIDPLKQQATVGSQQATREAQLANLRYAQQQLERTRRLYEEGVASKQSLDEAQSAYDAAKGSLESMEAQVKEQSVQLQYYTVAAPTPGVVGDIPVHVGDRVTTSTVLTTVDRSTDLEAYVNVPVESARALKLDQPIEILDSNGKPMASGKISFLSPRVDETTQTVLVKGVIENRDGSLRTAQFSRIRVVYGTHQGLKVPVLSVSRINGQSFVFVAAREAPGQVARLRQVQLGEIVGNDYVVLGGLSPGEQLIVSGTQFLADGAPVQPQS